MALPIAELAREKVTLLRAVESVYKERDQLMSAALAQEYVDHFLSEIPAPGVEAEWDLYQALLPQVSVTEINDLAASWTEPGDTGLLILRPESIDSVADDELSALLQTQLEEANTLEVEPYVEVFDDVPLLATLPTPGSIAGEEQIESIDALKWTLSNGITVIAKQTDFRNDEVLFVAFSPGGHSLVADEDPCLRSVRRPTGRRQWGRSARHCHPRQAAGRQEGFGVSIYRGDV